MDLGVLRGAAAEATTTEDGGSKTTTVRLSGGTALTLHFTRLTIDQNTGDKRIAVGVYWHAYSYTEEQYTVWKAAYRAFPETWGLAKAVYQSLGLLVTGQARCSDVSGTIGVVDFMSQEMERSSTASEAFELFLWFMALIAVNLGIINLLPLPALDGGRLIFIIIEMIRRKPVPPEKEGMVHLIGMIALLLRIVALTVGDIVRCFGG